VYLALYTGFALNLELLDFNSEFRIAVLEFRAYEFRELLILKLGFIDKII
jgi:hypothetical protein